MILPIMRRLWFEATTQALAEMKGRVERTDASKPTRMPLDERAQRVNALKSRLVGVHWSVDVEPSHKLQDQAQKSHCQRKPRDHRATWRKFKGTLKRELYRVFWKSCLSAKEHWLP